MVGTMGLNLLCNGRGSMGMLDCGGDMLWAGGCRTPSLLGAG
jgi:hypothetical protein